MHHLGEESCIGQELFVLFGETAVIRMFPWGMGIGRLAMQYQEREQAVGASDPYPIPDKLGFFPGQSEIHL